MFGVILRLALNSVFGFRKEHAAIVIESSLVGASFSIRQILLHVSPTPGEPTGYGSAVLGMHLYSWAAAVFVTAIAGTAVFPCLFRDEASGTRRPMARFERGTLYFSASLCLMNVLSAFAECRLGACCGVSMSRSIRD